MVKGSARRRAVRNGQRKAPGGVRWRAAPGSNRRDERKARGGESWPAAINLKPIALYVCGAESDIAVF
eukprot:6178784-Pleurochrysis_carterae.AAC.1